MTRLAPRGRNPIATGSECRRHEGPRYGSLPDRALHGRHHFSRNGVLLYRLGQIQRSAIRVNPFYPGNPCDYFSSPLPNPLPPGARENSGCRFSLSRIGVLLYRLGQIRRSAIRVNPSSPCDHFSSPLPSPLPPGAREKRRATKHPALQLCGGLESSGTKRPTLRDVAPIKKPPSKLGGSTNVRLVS
jgi:hypothetical protein